MIAQLVGEALLGWLVADFVGGVFHWSQDRLIPAKAPFIGPYLGEPARLHHRDRNAFLSGSFLYRNGPTIGLAAVWGSAALYFKGPSVFLAAQVLGGALATQAHYWTHRPKAGSRFVQALQETGLIQSAQQHAKHHRPPQKGYYCPLTDILNPVLEAISFWSRLEWLLSRVGVKFQGVS